MANRQQLWLIRHGETTWSRSGQHTGRTDLPLLPDGEAQARALAPRLATHPFALVLTSPLQRAGKTAALAGLSQAVPDPDLQEWDYGAYEGKTLQEIRTQSPGWTIWSGGVPGGETIEQVAARARRVIDRARAAGGDVALVSHGHLLRVLAACWLEVPPIQARHLALSTASINILSTDDQFPVIYEWNWRPFNSRL